MRILTGKRFRIGYAPQTSDSFCAALAQGLRWAAASRPIDLVEVENRYSIKVALPNAEHLVTGEFSGPYSSQCNEMNPFWPYFAQLNSYITRLQYISQTGTNISALALYRSDLPHGVEEQPPTPELNKALMNAG